MPTRQELDHAIRYAIEEDKIFMMETYKKWYPNIFQHASMDIRSATPDDYYIPNNLPCRVVENMRFEHKLACDEIACFPFKQYGKPCENNDPPQISYFGNVSTVSCQPICKYSRNPIDTEWWNDKCVLVNPLKKILVMFPEQVFGRQSIHSSHIGLDWVNGQMCLNESYCKAYGLEFNGRECEMSTAQYIGEFFLGSTVYRSIKTSSLQPPKPLPAPMNLNLKYVNPPVTVDEISDTTQSSEIAKDIVKDLSIDFGFDVTLHVVENILKKRAPKLILKAASSTIAKKVLTQAVIKNAAPLIAKSIIHMGKAISVTSIVFSIFSISTLIVDLVDPNMYNFLLTGKMIDNLNRRLDLRYFQREKNFNQTVTPNLVWDNILDLEDESFRWTHMTEKVEEYIQALHPNEITKPPPRAQFDVSTFREEKEIEYWNWTLHLIVLGMLLSLCIFWVQYIHVWIFMVWCGIFYFS